MLPWAALMLLACGDSPPLENPPEETVLTVTWDTAAPETCRIEDVLLSVSITGGDATEVALYRGTTRLATLSAPYKYNFQCATFPDDTYTFVVKATASGRSFQSPEKTIVIDRTPPQFVGWRPKTKFPAMGEPLELVFSEPIDPNSLESAPITLRDSEGFSVAYQRTLSEDGRAVRIVPTQPLVPPFTLTAEVIQKTMTDRAGNLLDQNLVGERFQSFAYWPFVHVDEGIPQAGFITMSAYASTADGQRVAAWIESRSFPEVPGLGVARWNGQTWERLQAPILESEGSTGPRELKVAMTADHQIVLAWLEENKSLHVKRFDGTAWQRVGSSPNPERGDTSRLRLALDPNGGPVLAWQDLKDIHVARWDGFFWNRLGGPISANPEEGSLAQYPAIVAQTDRLVLAWSERPTGNSESAIHAWEYRGGAWSPLGQPLRASSNTGTVALTLDGFSAPVLAWQEYAASATYAIYLSRFTSSREWTVPEQVIEPRPMNWWSTPAVTVDPRGFVWVAWEEAGEGHDQDILYRRRNSSGWGAVQLVGKGEIASFEVDPQSFPWVAVSIYGNDGGVVLTRPR